MEWLKLLVLFWFTVIAFHFIWNNPTHELPNNRLVAFETYLFHHPSWQLGIYTNKRESASDLLKPLVARGYNITIISLEESNEFLCPEAHHWLHKNKARSDEVLKLAILYCFGGIYSDLDVVAIRPFSIQDWLDRAGEKREGTGRLFFGLQKVAEANKPCPSCIGPNKDTLVLPTVIGAEKKSPILKEAINLLSTQDNISLDSALIRATKKLPLITAYLPAGYVFPPLVSHQTWSTGHSSHGLDDLLSESAYAFKLALGSQIDKHSIAGVALKRFGISHTDWIESCQIKSRPYLEVSERSKSIGSAVRILCTEEFTQFETLEVSLLLDSGTIICNGKAAPNVTLIGRSEADLNKQLAECQVRTEESPLHIRLAGVEKSLHAFDVSSQVTIVIKTMGRLQKILDLVESIRNYYPGIRILVGDDGPVALSTPPGPKRGFEYVPFSFDIGLSEGRNQLLKHVKTKAVQFLDDDFKFGPASDLGRLYWILARDGFDIVGGKSVGERKQYHGKMKILSNRKGGRRLVLLPGSYPRTSAQQKLCTDGEACCDHVDFVPNLFMARTSLFIKDSPRWIQWDGGLKVGEHEDFFLRAKFKDLKVAFCSGVGFEHHQEAKEAMSAEYAKLRNRSPFYIAEMLRKFELDELVAFGETVVRLIDLEKNSIKRMVQWQHLPCSVRISWETLQEYPHYKIEVYEADNGRLRTEHILDTPEMKFNGGARDIRIDTLEPGMGYRVALKPGNFTHFAQTGPSFLIKAPSFFASNLLVNPTFDGTTRGWKLSFGARMTTIGLFFPRNDPAYQQRVSMGEFVGHVEGRQSSWAFANRSSRLDRNYALMVQLPVSPPKLDGRPLSSYFVDQEIPASRIPRGCRDKSGSGCVVDASGWVKVDHAFGEPTEVLLAMELVIETADGAIQKYTHHLDPRERKLWQYGCLASIILSGGVKKITFGFRFVSPRAVFFLDDCYLAVRPAPVVNI